MSEETTPQGSPALSPLKHWQLLQLAISFCSRLCTGPRASATDMGKAFMYLPIVGLLLGSILILPFYCGLFSGLPLIQGWAYTLLMLWTTRALHMDGLADVLDALGSGKSGEDFQRIMHDSRIGVFGATGIAMACAGYIILSFLAFRNETPLLLVWAALVGRSLPICLTFITPPHPKGGLGKVFQGIPPKTALLLATLTVLLGTLFFASPAILLTTLCLCGLLLFLLRSYAIKEGGYTGDFLGFSIVAGELAALASPLFFL